MTTWRYRTVITILAAIIVLIIVLPILWMFISSIQLELDLITPPPKIIPVKPTLQYYIQLLQDNIFVNGYKNSLVVAVATTLLSVTLGSLGAYAIARIVFPGRKALYRMVMFAYMLPGVALLIPLVTILRILNLLDTHLGMILGHSSIILPLVMWLSIGAYAGFQADLEDAARMDGCTRTKAFIRVVLPITIRSTGTAAAFAFIISWNELMFSSVISVVKINMLAPTIVGYMSVTRLVYPQLFAAGIMAGIPVMLIAMVLQKYIIRELGAGTLR